MPFWEVIKCRFVLSRNIYVKLYDNIWTYTRWMAYNACIAQWDIHAHPL